MTAETLSPLSDAERSAAPCQTSLAESVARRPPRELLRFFTCGSVDDGKSTLIGRLLIDAGAVHDDQLDRLRADSARHGTTGAELDAALLLDGLEDERQQGITIDVAYRYFSTTKRTFIIADTPGHEQFTRNMATGASNSELAVIVVDATKGLLVQTRRHAFIASLLGIQHVFLAVNKMDRVDYSQTVFARIRDDFCRVAEKLSIPDLRFIPLSALRGDNVAEPSAQTPWYADGSLLHLLETVHVVPAQRAGPLRFPVQWVNRPHAEFRGLCGTLASGEVRVGDEVVILPSRRTSRIRSIVTCAGDVPVAVAPAAATLTLADEIDVTRGDVLATPAAAPLVAREAEASLIWMSEQPLALGKQYWCKLASQKTVCEVRSIRCAIDVDTQREAPAATLRMNELGQCRLGFHDPLVLDEYARNKTTGALILVDRITHETVAAGVVRQALAPRSRDHWQDAPTGWRLERATSLVSPERRATRFGHRPGTVLVTGPSAAGKTTLARELEHRLFELGCVVALLDGQSLRFGISRDLGFSAEERSENLRRAAEIARLVNDVGQICVAAFAAPEDAVRRRAKALIGPERLVHVHLATPLAVCRRRDALGRYQAAEAGEIENFPGVTFPYEAPTDADVIASTEARTAPDIADEVVSLLESRGWLGPEILAGNNADT
ncbi:MAG: sulfate adenylyltransferase subunit CysN [Pirellulales bacterium]|nr:sulfate adenylyltransferase subunit CysN [Pirellulales bacterium]